MRPKVVKGNAVVEGENRWGWFVGHFVNPTDDPRKLSTLEVKWTVHKAGEERLQWAMNAEATTISILINGRFRLQFPEQEVLLSREGDYVLWLPSVPHCWSAESDSTVLTIRWPSVAGDSLNVPMPSKV